MTKARRAVAAFRRLGASMIEARTAQKGRQAMLKVPWFLGILGLVLALAFVSLVISPRSLCGDRGSDTRARIVCPMFF
jgi:hypothetical protein